MKLKTKLAELIQSASEQKTYDERIKILHENDSIPLRVILKCCFDPKVEFLLPEGPAPYKPSEDMDVESALFGQVRKMYIFVKNGNSVIFGVPDSPGVQNMPKVKREKLFVDFLEGLSPADAKLMEAIKDKKMPYKGITRKLVIKAYPGLISDEQDV